MAKSLGAGSRSQAKYFEEDGMEYMLNGLSIEKKIQFTKFLCHTSCSYLAHLTFPSTLCVSPSSAESKDVFPLPTRPTIMVNLPIIKHKNNIIYIYTESQVQ